MSEQRLRRPYPMLKSILEPSQSILGSREIGVWFRERIGMTMATIIARRGQSQALAEVVRTRFGCALPSEPRYVRKGFIAFVGIGTNKWLAIDYQPGLSAVAFDGLRDLASVSDQSSGYLLVDIGGSQAVEALQKGCTFDLNPATFRAGYAAPTGMFYTAVILWRTNVGSTYQIAVPRSWAPSFMEAFLAGTWEFAIDVFAPVVTSDPDALESEAQV